MYPADDAPVTELLPAPTLLDPAALLPPTDDPAVEDAPADEDGDALADDAREDAITDDPPAEEPIPDDGAALVADEVAVLLAPDDVDPPLEEDDVLSLVPLVAVQAATEQQVTTRTRREKWMRMAGYGSRPHNPGSTGG